MITRAEQQDFRRRAVALFETAGVLLTDSEREHIEVVDFGLSNVSREGAQILTLVQTERISVKLLALLPYQTEPEHWHPPVGGDPGKEETIRHVFGDLYFYVSGQETLASGFVPEGKDRFYTCRQELVMSPGDQLTCQPGDKHWFQAGRRGAVLYSFSTVARDVLDKFSDPDIVRTTKIADE